MKKHERDEYLLHKTPSHTFPRYTLAHALAGDLKLADDVPKPKQDEQNAVLERLSRK